MEVSKRECRNQKKKNNMVKEAREYFMQLPQFDKMIRRKQEMMAEIKELSWSISVNTDRTGTRTRGTEDRMGDMVALYVDLERELERDIAVFMSMKSKAMDLIDRLPDLREREVMYLRYLKFQPFYKIALDMCLSESRMYDVHREALIHLHSEIKKEEGCLDHCKQGVPVEGT